MVEEVVAAFILLSEAEGFFEMDPLFGNMTWKTCEKLLREEKGDAPELSRAKATASMCIDAALPSVHP
jgi:hypothetical protein